MYVYPFIKGGIECYKTLNAVAKRLLTLANFPVSVTLAPICRAPKVSRTNGLSNTKQ